MKIETNALGNFRRVLKLVLSYLLAVGIILWLARDISLEELKGSLEHARLSLFLPVTIISFLLWFLGENLLYSRLFSYFHGEATYLEMLPLSATLYFLQVVNGALAGGAFTVLMNKRKGVPWLESGFTMLFLGLIDFQVMAVMVLVAALLARDSPLGFTWRYAAAALALCWAIAWFWLRGRPRGNLALRIYDWPPMSCFRKARLSHYFRLMLIRLPIFLLQGVTFYLDFLSFGVHVPMGYVFTLTPAILFLTALPITPLGLGSEQAAIVLGFRAFGSKATLLAVSLAISVMGILLRLPLGLFTAHQAARALSPRRSI